MKCHLSNEPFYVAPSVKAELKVLKALCAIDGMEQAGQLKLLILTPLLQHPLDRPQMVAKEIPRVMDDVSSANCFHKLFWRHAHCCDDPILRAVSCTKDAQL